MIIWNNAIFIYFCLLRLQFILNQNKQQQTSEKTTWRCIAIQSCSLFHIQCLSTITIATDLTGRVPVTSLHTQKGRFYLIWIIAGARWALKSHKRHVSEYTPGDLSPQDGCGSYKIILIGKSWHLRKCTVPSQRQEVYFAQASNFRK